MDVLLILRFRWKRSRTMVAPGFNANYLLGQMEHILEETSVFVDILREHARQGVIFSLDRLTCDFTMDIIGAVCLNSRLNSQRQFNSLASAMRSQVMWHCGVDELNLFKRWNPARPFVQWKNSRTMNNYVSKELDQRFAERQGNKKDISSRSIIDLVLDNYMAENPMLDSAKGLDHSFKKWAQVQIRLMIFAGHDSTASTICYCYYLLSKHPDALARIRAEHDKIFGTDLTKVANLLLKTPQLINTLSYTNAVMKEALRLFPPASALRGGEPGVELRDSHGNRYPTEGTSLFVIHARLQRNPQYWKDPDSFIPERWLVGHEDPLYPPKGGWRSFEFGPRNCVGQTLVVQDIKTVLAMTLREFDILPAYEEYDKLHPTTALKTVSGERAYQIPSGASHPADGFPCRVAVTSDSGHVDL
jgi:cytochrome P450